MESKGSRVADSNVMAFAENKVDLYHDLDGSDLTVSIANELTLIAFQVLVKEGKLKPDEVQVIYKNKVITLDRDGRLSRWPKGMADVYTALARKMCT